MSPLPTHTLNPSPLNGISDNSDTKQNFLKTLQEKEEMLVTSIFFSHNVLYPIYPIKVILYTGASARLQILNSIRNNLTLTSPYFSPVPNKLLFLHCCNTSFLKTLWEKGEILLMSDFSFSHCVFYAFGGLSAIFS